MGREKRIQRRKKKNGSVKIMEEKLKRPKVTKVAGEICSKGGCFQKKTGSDYNRFFGGALLGCEQDLSVHQPSGITFFRLTTQKL